jgi:hypothetical protein
MQEILSTEEELKNLFNFTITAEQANELEKERISVMLGLPVEKLKNDGYFD